MTSSFRAVVIPILIVLAAGAPSLRGQRAARSAAPRTPSATAPRTPPPAAPVIERPVPFAVGETLTYDVSWSGYLTAGTATMTVKEKKPSYNAVAYYVVAEGRPTPLLSHLYTLYYKMDALIDASTLLSQRGSLYSEEGKRHRYQVTEFNRATNMAHTEFQTSADDVQVAPSAQDILSTIYALRARDLKAGDQASVPVSDRGNAYTVQAAVTDLETASTPMGSLPAWKLAVGVTDGSGKPVGKNLALWITNDARRLPAKLQADLPVGSFSLGLRSVVAGTGR